MNNKDPHEKEKQQLDEALNLFGDNLRNQSLEYSKFKTDKHFHHESYCRKCNTIDTNNEVIDLSPPQEWLYKCDCPNCISGMHYNKEIAEAYRNRGKITNEVARLRCKVDSLIAAINTAITEWPSNQASIYLDGIMKNLSK